MSDYNPKLASLEAAVDEVVDTLHHLRDRCSNAEQLHILSQVDELRERIRELHSTSDAGALERLSKLMLDHLGNICTLFVELFKKYG